MLHSVLEGHLDQIAYRSNPLFGFQVPEACPAIPNELLDPRCTWEDLDEYDLHGQRLVARFKQNFEPFLDIFDANLIKGGPL
jgi:phosphoenolpyruvate carboxykinase (ATP)